MTIRLNEFVIYAVLALPSVRVLLNIACLFVLQKNCNFATLKWFNKQILSDFIVNLCIFVQKKIKSKSKQK